MAASAGIFGQAVTAGHSMHIVTKQIAEIADFFRELLSPLIRIVGKLKQQRMTAALANILAMIVAFANGDVTVAENKARNRVTDACGFAFTQVGRSTAALLHAACHAGEGKVIDAMSE